VVAWPNPRMQRTPSAPLMRKPLGGRKALHRRYVALLVASFLACTEQRRTPCVYEIPEQFRGWLLIEFAPAGCPPIPVENGKRVFRFPPSGRLCLSGSEEYGVAKDEFYFVGTTTRVVPQSAPGGNGLLWGGGNGSVGSRTFEHFFVGSEQEMAKQPLPELLNHLASETPRPPA